MKKYDMNDRNNEKFLWSKKINYWCFFVRIYVKTTRKFTEEAEYSNLFICRKSQRSQKFFSGSDYVASRSACKNLPKSAHFLGKWKIGVRLT